MGTDDGEPPDDGDLDDPSTLEPFDPDLIRDMMEGAISAVVREQGLLNAAWDELEHREQVVGRQMRRMDVMASWLGAMLGEHHLAAAGNDNS